MKVKVGTGAWTDRMQYPIVQSNEEKISPKCVLRGLIELSTMSNGSTPFPFLLLVYHIYNCSISAKFLKCGNKRVGDSGDDLWEDVPRPTAWLAG